MSLEISRKEYHVVKIIDDMNIIINGGGRDGLQEGDCFYILSETGAAVVDPQTGEGLGIIKQIKAKVQITALYEKMCICQNARRSPSVLLSASALAALDSLGGERLSLNVEPSQISGGLHEEVDEPIRIGDVAELVRS